jgi:hypothetical protein
MPKLRKLPIKIYDTVMPDEEAWQLLLIRRASMSFDSPQPTGSQSSQDAGRDARLYRAPGDAVLLVGLSKKLELEHEGCPGADAGDSLFSAVAQLILGRVRPADTPPCSHRSAP